MSYFDDVHLIAQSVAGINASLRLLVSVVTGSPIGILAEAGHPIDRPRDHPTQREHTMPKVTLTTSVKGAKAATKTTKAKAGDAPGDFVLLDTQDDSIEVFGTDSAGNQLDISGVASLTVVSSDPAVVSVDPPTGMKFLSHALKVSTCKLTITATWNDPATIGPFTIDFPLDVQSGGATGLKIVPGTPTVR